MKPSKVVAGLEADKTNHFLQVLAKAAIESTDKAFEAQSTAKSEQQQQQQESGSKNKTLTNKKKTAATKEETVTKKPDQRSKPKSEKSKDPASVVATHDDAAVVVPQQTSPQSSDVKRDESNDPTSLKDTQIIQKTEKHSQQHASGKSGSPATRSTFAFSCSCPLCLMIFNVSLR